ncbi:hypothetical protein DPEC_G00097950 [Dallia pectoralis]|uniref:Uncharacterized protein n=1 Tax=Dallia pectoralis TaxID=75939 RepID=A0ACC2GWA6_DALPE|nr:hypothetical protein DPEC_G00097950 [Dallia pectoralis]
MTIGKNSRKGSVRAPKFLDKSTGFYCHLDEPETAAGGEEGNRATGMRGDLGGLCSATDVYTGAEAHQEEHGLFDFYQGMMEDDNTTLLWRKSNRLSSRLRRSIRKSLPQTLSPSLDTGTEMETDTPVLEVTMVEMKSRWRRSIRKKQPTESHNAAPWEEDLTLGEERGTQTPELEVLEVEMKVEAEKCQRDEEKKTLDATREETDDQVLIKEKKRGREEETEEDGKKVTGQEEMKKRSTLKNYRKAFDRALRRGWENFITNLYSLLPLSRLSDPETARMVSRLHLIFCVLCIMFNEGSLRYISFLTDSMSTTQGRGFKIDNGNIEDLFRTAEEDTLRNGPEMVEASDNRLAELNIDEAVKFPDVIDFIATFQTDSVSVNDGDNVNSQVNLYQNNTNLTVMVDSSDISETVAVPPTDVTPLDLSTVQDALHPVHQNILIDQINGSETNYYNLSAEANKLMAYSGNSVSTKAISSVAAEEHNVNSEAYGSLAPDVYDFAEFSGSTSGLTDQMDFTTEDPEIKTQENVAFSASGYKFDYSNLKKIHLSTSTDDAASPTVTISTVEQSGGNENQVVAHIVAHMIRYTVESENFETIGDYHNNDNNVASSQTFVAPLMRSSYLDDNEKDMTVIASTAGDTVPVTMLEDHVKTRENDCNKEKDHLRLQ